ncbi:hypothetical protein [Rubinisphaera brasiliensis]|uniref:Uncharacterized protein n=1 Tax=Rubinisphaera brasiliensis (strain ATCC 49424 / DSM 5305 / JCM 21570 / IAM 15109 / NBRC 103401 / IFAM 1448) TaxID=756272 RepID=F0SQD7_RUBBR|nr:hypothetical protein [Rubinisphaera brasiliensis]ADY62316.1 hypothetical protein Plabr_4745 [Rubinisphaera brasiliensis DSM 5305]
MKQAWRDEDQAQRDARLNYVSTLGGVHQTSEAAQAAAVLTYQQARAAANRIEQDARATLRVDFNKLQASTFADETAGWLTSAPTPWHKQLAIQADAESTYRAVEQDASLLQQQAEHAANENYLDDRETARVTLRTDRAAASAAEAFTEQQNLENGHEYGDEYYDDHDPYQNVTIDLPTSLNYDGSSDPDGVSHTLDDDHFSGQFTLGGTFGSQIGGGAYSPDDPEGSYYGEYSNYGLADQQASQVRGGTFDANNPLGALGRSDTQINGTQTVNWGNSPRNQQTNQQPPTQIVGLQTGEAPEWQSGGQFEFANGEGPAFGSDFGSFGDSYGNADRTETYYLYDEYDNFLGTKEVSYSNYGVLGSASPSTTRYVDANGNEVGTIDADREELNFTDADSQPGQAVPTRPQSLSSPDIVEPQNSNGLTNEEQYALQQELGEISLSITHIQNTLAELRKELANAGSWVSSWLSRDEESIQTDIDYHEDALREKQRQAQRIYKLLDQANTHKLEAGDWVAKLSLEEKFQAALNIAEEKGYIQDALGGQFSGMFSSDFIRNLVWELAQETGLRAAGSATGVGGIVAAGLTLKDLAEISAEILEAYLEVRDAYTETMLDDAAKVLANKIAAIISEKLADRIVDPGSKKISGSLNDLAASPKRVGEVPSVDTTPNGPDADPGDLPADLQANVGGGAGGQGFNAGQNAGGSPNTPIPFGPNNNRRTPSHPIGFVPGTADSALQNIGRIDHAGRHLSQFIEGRPQSRAYRDAVRGHATRILENPAHTFDHELGGLAVRGFVGDIDGHVVVFFVAKESKGKINQGDLVTAIEPSPQQRANWGI